MTKKIARAEELAGEIAEIILEGAYQGQIFDGLDRRVHDVMLFGSALTGSGNDLDMLVIHSLRRLAEFGVITQYKSKGLEDWPELIQGFRIGHPMMYIDPTGRLDTAPNDAEAVLEAMGSRKIPYVEDYVNIFLDATRVQIHKMKYAPGGLNLPGLYQGEIDLGKLGLLQFDTPQSLRDIHDKVESVINEKIRAPKPVNRVRKLLETRGLNMSEDLDLLAMDIRALRPGDVPEREIAIRQCNDPTFFMSILQSGKLYTPSSKRFDASVEAKYPGAVMLFNPALYGIAPK